MKKMSIAVALLAVGVSGLAGCGAGTGTTTGSAAGGSAATSAATTDPATPTTAATTAATTAPATTAATGSGGAAGGSTGGSSGGSSGGDCLETQLRASIDPRHIPGNGTLDSAGQTKKGVLVDFENTSKTTCNLIGYPGAATVSSTGSQVTQATRTLRGQLGGLPSGTSKIPVVALAPGHYAAAMIEGVDMKKQGAAQAGCDVNLPRILVTPPNTKIAVPFTVAWPACYSFDIHPVTALTSAP